MRRFRERNRARTGLVGVAVVLVLIIGALEFPRLPLIHSSATFTAEFANAGGLSPGDIVTIDGVKVGTITGMSLAGDKVDVTFAVQTGLHLGSTTSADAEVLSPVGTEYLQLAPSGSGHLEPIIPESRTSVPYNFITALSGLGSVIEGYNIPELEKSLEVSSQDLSGTSAKDMTAAFTGLARISKVLASEQSQLSAVVSQGAGLTQVLSQRSQQLFDLFGQAKLVLQVVVQRKAAIDQLLSATSTLSKEITAILSDNNSQLKTLLQSLQSVSAILSKDSSDFGKAIPVLAAFSRYSANSTGSGPFADVAVPTLLIPDNLSVQCSSKGSYPSGNPVVGCRP